ncbi:MAG TPA: peroxiredoxin [Flavobacteriales bacterium]|jgi:peroxiredoxin Q/BCP|nr:peroxiredoxin [Flavobacteriales bacterium]
MKTGIIVLVALAALAFLAFRFVYNGKSKTLRIGDKMPIFELPDQDGNDFNIKKLVGKNNLVVYFYPKDDTPGCTKEACAFRDQFEAFSDLDAVVIGISGDSPESHREFREKHNLPFTLLSDEEDMVHDLFGVKSGLIPGRVTFVVDKKGIIKYTFDSMMNATQHVEEAKKILQDLG